MTKTLLTILATLTARQFVKGFFVGACRANPQAHAQLVRRWYYQLEHETAEYRVHNKGKDPDTSGYESSDEATK